MQSDIKEKEPTTQRKQRKKAAFVIQMQVAGSKEWTDVDIDEGVVLTSTMSAESYIKKHAGNFNDHNVRIVQVKQSFLVKIEVEEKVKLVHRSYHGEEN